MQNGLYDDESFFYVYSNQYQPRQGLIEKQLHQWFEPFG